MGKKLTMKIHKRDGIIDFLQRTEKFLRSGDELDEDQIKFRLEKLELKWDEFDEVQSEIEGCEEYESNADAHREIRADFEEKYFEVRAGLVKKLPQRSGQVAMQNIQQNESFDSTGVHSYVRLPQINLPEFDGNYEKWLPFHDTFRALIDSSPQLSNIQKFHYLRASLKGDALRLVDSFPMSDANYRVAWDGLVSRFSNRYLLKKRHLNALFEYPRMKKASAAGIHDLIDCFERNTQILDQLGETTSGWGAMLTHLMVSKLSETIQVQSEEHVSQKDEPSFKMLVTFLKTQTRILDAVFVDQRIFSTSVTSSAVGSKSHPTKLSVNSATETSGPNCIACSEQHFLSRCPSFNKLPVDKRLQLTNSKRLCSNCLGRNHLARDCPSKYRCRTCSKKHHTLLHPGFPGSGSTATSTSSQDDNSASPSTSGVTPNSGGMVSSSVATISSNMAMGGSKSHVFLLTAVLEMKDYCGRIHHARALLDSGSQENLMSERFCQLLKLPRRNKRVEIVGIGQARRRTAYEVSTNIASRIRDFSILMDFLVLGQVTDNQPSTSLPLETWKPPQDMVLADPGFYASGPIDLVLGSQFFYDFHLLHGGRFQIRKINDDLPVFVNTVFGWVAAGEANLGGNFGRVSCNLALADPLDKAIEKFWTIEELSEKPQRSQEEKDCEAHFQHTITRDDTGRYMARYPKRAGFYEMIGDSKETARRRFLQIERRLGKNANLRKHYNAFMQEYIDLGHMKAVGMVDEIPKTEKTVCYLPHHPVFKESSSTTKVRVVFDGSAKTSSNYSLNEILLTGPVIQDDLFDLMLRFRKNAVALVADVEKMYRQIRIHQEDTPLQRILWRFDPRDPVQIYELQTVTYGLAPSSFLATRVLQQLSMDYQAKYSKGSLAVSEDFYMDDLLSGADTVENARKLRDEVQALLAEGGFQLRKWSSNRSELLQDLPSEVLGVADTLRFEPEQKIKTLGVVWDPQLDQLCIEVQPIEADTQWTKRKIFSAIAKLYDPLGLVSPVVAWAKMRLQHLWLASIGWDDPVLPEIESKWTEFYSQLPLLQSFRVTRFIWLPDTSTVQFHVFCDASEVGYGACIYARSISLEGHVKVELIASKSRVAPLKRISLPRLELCSALLAAKLYSKISAALRMEGKPCWFWSDSMVTLHWIRAPPNTWQTFIGNRTSEIQLLTHGHNWRHVKGSDNPADQISRGALPKDFINSMNWLHGPAWLLDDEHWPYNATLDTPSEELLERRKTVAVSQNVCQPDSLFERYSSFLRLVRVTAYILRFVNRCRSKNNRTTESFLSTNELNEAKQGLAKGVQHKEFAQELKDLKQGKPVSRQSSLKLLRPFLDEKGIIRLWGRIQQSDESYQTKHPIALPSKHPLGFAR
ncbi:uncharacterized protein LOC131425280 [Malaya genurostris]|uniref:uncharacterized protein LOC131425280 n=1 Tax=Malaya genurostris TaxID=325434 RepID=UPI0026F3EE9F|nr:uncharacterized protein LOC131425280 [Malaya genurostris]